MQKLQKNKYVNIRLDLITKNIFLLKREFASKKTYWWQRLQNVSKYDKILSTFFVFEKRSVIVNLTC